MEAQFPETEQSPEAADGEASHWAMAELLAGRDVHEGQQAANGVFLDLEMIEGAQLLVDDVLATCRAYGIGSDAIACEVPVSMPRIHPQAWGTPDVRLWAPGGVLCIWDYKFGHRIVEVFENAQLVDYIVGCIDQAGLDDRGVTVVAKIVQPRAYHKHGVVRTWRCTGSDLRALANISSNAVHEALGPDPRARVGDECRDCRARHACPTLQRAALSACDMAGRAQSLELPPDAAALEYRMLKRAAKMLDARVAGLEEQLLSTLKRGQRVPGLIAEHGTGRRKWSKPASDVISLGQMLGVDLAKPPEAITPVQAVAKGLPEAVLPEFTTVPRAAATLVEDDGSLTRRVFGASR